MAVPFVVGRYSYRPVSKHTQEVAHLQLFRHVFLNPHQPYSLSLLHDTFVNPYPPA